MGCFRGDRQAFGWPGIEPRWTQGNKDGVGTAYSGDSYVWFTMWKGVVTEVYYPTIDRPQIRDLQLLISDGESFFHEEKRHLHTEVSRFTNHALGYIVTKSDPEGRYKIVKEVIGVPHHSCLMQHTRLVGQKDVLSKLRVYALCAPHLDVGGWDNNAYVMEVAGREILVAEKKGTWLALGASVPFAKASCGFVGFSDGWTDLNENYKMTWDFDCALNGNVAVTGELALDGAVDFTLALAFGSSQHDAATTLLQALGVPYREHRKRFVDQWHRVCKRSLPLGGVSSDGGNLYEGSQSLLLAHEDKKFAGAVIASMSIPWGEAKGDEDMGGYHLVWTRDMVHSSMGLLAAGNTDTPLRALIYLAASQNADGGFFQNFWVNGEPYWKGIQLDEVAFPILLAFRLKEEKGLGEFDPYSMVIRAARYLIIHGPATPQERWEEASGYSPSTLASNIAGLIAAACFARAGQDAETAQYLEAYADFLNRHVEEWTVTTTGTVHPSIPKHYIRIHPVDPADPDANEDPNEGMLTLANGPIGDKNMFPAKEIVDHGFLELVRYGIRDPQDPIIIDSLRVVDAVLKKDTPFGPCWHRYNHDGYGQCDDGSAFRGSGTGRLWPLLTGERGMYELAAGHDVRPYIQALEGFASCAGLIPEQVWDREDLPDMHLFLGRPTGSAMPLMWAHSEYIQLLRSAYDGGVFDLVPAVAARYLFGGGDKAKKVEFWKPNRYAKRVKTDETLRVQAPTPFRLRWSLDGWKTVQESSSKHLQALNVDYVDIDVTTSPSDAVVFTFFWVKEDRWEQKNFSVPVVRAS